MENIQSFNLHLFFSESNEDTESVMWYNISIEPNLVHGLCYMSGAAMADYQTQYQALGSCDEDDTDETDAPTHESANLMIHVVPESSMSSCCVIYKQHIFVFFFGRMLEFSIACYRYYYYIPLSHAIGFFLCMMNI